MCFDDGPCLRISFFYVSYFMALILTNSPMEAGQNTSTVALRVVKGGENGTRCLRV
jgi:hypothetical protein